MAATDTSPLLEILGTFLPLLLKLVFCLTFSLHYFHFSPAREPEGYSLWDGPPFNNGEPRVKLAKVPCSTSKYSEDGSRLMVIKPDSKISIYDCSSSTEIRSFEIPNFLAATLSPRGTYLQTFQKVSTPQEKNVVLWNIETGTPVYQLFQKSMSRTTW